MTTVATPQQSSGTDQAASLVPRPGPGDAARTRGRLEVTSTAVERVVEGAARTVPGVRPVSHRVGADRLTVSARVLGEVASVSMEVAVAYPSAVRETCRQLRSTVVSEVSRLVGVEVTRLDLQVVELQHRPGSARRVR